jgi:hypothetical protein
MADLDPAGNITTSGGKKVPMLRDTPTMYVDRSIVIYGPSKTGKTVITKNIMKSVNGHIEQIIIISPNEPTNKSYEGFVKPQFIHYRIFLPDPENSKKDNAAAGALRFLNAIWKRQEMLSAVYARANDSKTLSDLFMRLPEKVRNTGVRLIQAMNSKRKGVMGNVRRQYAKDPGNCLKKEKEVTDKFKQMLVLLYKKYITPFRDALWQQDLSENERFSLEYLNINPRMLLIFDDCAAQMKPLFKKEIFSMLFYQNRHVHITVLICCQDDSDLPPNLRKNAFVSFFTTPVVAGMNFRRPANGFSKPIQQFIDEISPEVFKGNRKLAYVREDDDNRHFCHIEYAYPTPFLFGSVASHELCDSLHASGALMDKENPFYSQFVH